MQNTFLCFGHFFEKTGFWFPENLKFLNEDAFKLKIQGDILNPHVKLNQNIKKISLFFFSLGVIGEIKSYTVFSTKVGRMEISELVVW